jgi:hypothetical protein
MGGDYAVGGGPAGWCPGTFPGVVFSGDSGWFIVETVESFNGRQLTIQGNFLDWFAANAFGGTYYENTPVGAVSHLEEPQLGGINSPEIYFGLWEAQRYFCICAWLSRNTPFFQAVGDPFTAK